MKKKNCSLVKVSRVSLKYFANNCRFEGKLCQFYSRSFWPIFKISYGLMHHRGMGTDGRILGQIFI